MRALVVVDSRAVPEMNGCDSLVAARHIPARGDTRIVLVTTESERSQVQHTLAAGANQHVLKPSTRDVLREQLRLVGLATT